ncbi:hypothetical protein TNCV_310651 [Trichonephila clavipes]|nr:hypothetical protein TNCV_310651 [Trichonephila clavipes]
MHSTKELIKKDVLMPDGTDKDQDSKINDSVHPTVLSSSQNHAMPVKNNILLWSPWKLRCGQRTVRLAGYSIQWLSTTPRSLHAQAQQIQTRTETMGLLRIREREKAEMRNDGGARAGVTIKTSSKLIC